MLGGTGDGISWNGGERGERRTRKGGRGKEDEERETRKREDEKKGGKPHHKVRLPYL